LIVSEKTYLNKKPEGEWIYYHSNGKKLKIENYSSGKLNGLVQIYYESGPLKAEISYQNDLIVDVYKEYYENGSVKSETSYKFGRKHGPFIELTEDQKVRIKGQFAGNKKVEKWLYFNEMGELAKTETYLNNELVNTQYENQN
jgi:antitoxin component YwqK of YwqJK toxin-antitoxin module